MAHHRVVTVIGAPGPSADRHLDLIWLWIWLIWDVVCLSASATSPAGGHSDLPEHVAGTFAPGSGPFPATS